MIKSTKNPILVVRNLMDQISFIKVDHFLDNFHFELTMYLFENCLLINIGFDFLILFISLLSNCYSIDCFQKLCL